MVEFLRVRMTTGVRRPRVRFGFGGEISLLASLWSAFGCPFSTGKASGHFTDNFLPLWPRYEPTVSTADFEALLESLEQACASALSPKPAGTGMHGGGISTPLIEDRNKALLENERLKSQLMSERRALLAARQRQVELAARNAELTSRNAKLTDAVCDLASTNKALHAALIARHQGRVRIHETHRGVVSEVCGDQVEVTYETAEGPLKQIYHRDQFAQGKLPTEGEAIEAHVMVAASEPKAANEKELDVTSDLPTFSDRAVSGPLRI